MMLYLDTETYSEVDLKTAGTHRYAEHESTEIMVAQWAIGDGEPVVEDLTDNPAPSEALRDMLLDSSMPIVIHNSAFDRTLSRHCWGIEIDPERIIDTMVMAMSHSLPGALDKLGPILGMRIEDQKDKRGKQLIQLFCKPRPKNMILRRATRLTHPAEWAEFLEYSRQDIIAMREVHRKLPKWNYDIGKPEHALWCLDQRINDRGFMTDVELAEAAVKATIKTKVDLTERVQYETGGEVESATKRDQLLKFILEAHGVNLPDMKADTLRRRANDPELPEAVRTLVNIRLEASMTTAGKYKALVNAVSPDNRLRNALQFSGAVRTQRWCLAEGTLVTVAERSGAISEKPIQHVALDDLVWDGEEWVPHEGVVFSGNKQVIEHDGIVASPEHVVYYSTTEHTTLADAKARGLKLWEGTPCTLFIV